MNSKPQPIQGYPSFPTNPARLVKTPAYCFSLTLEPQTNFCRTADRILLLLLMIKILHYLKDPKLWEFWYIPYYG